MVVCLLRLFEREFRDHRLDAMSRCELNAVLAIRSGTRQPTTNREALLDQRSYPRTSARNTTTLKGGEGAYIEGWLRLSSVRG